MEKEKKVKKNFEIVVSECNDALRLIQNYRLRSQEIRHTAEDKERA